LKPIAEPESRKSSSMNRNRRLIPKFMETLIFHQLHGRKRCMEHLFHVAKTPAWSLSKGTIASLGLSSTKNQ
jgi:hypothetical protein